MLLHSSWGIQRLQFVWARSWWSFFQCMCWHSYIWEDWNVLIVRYFNVKVDDNVDSTCGLEDCITSNYGRLNILNITMHFRRQSFWHVSQFWEEEVSLTICIDERMWCIYIVNTFRIYHLHPTQTIIPYTCKLQPQPHT